MKIHFFANSFGGDTISGGDVNLLKMAQAITNAGHELNFFGGHAVKNFVEKSGIPANYTLTDDTPSTKFGKLDRFRDWYSRYRRTLPLLDTISPKDGAYAVSDYWCDTQPLARSNAGKKVMILLMRAPTLGQALFSKRPDVVGNRLSSIHYAISQGASLKTMARHGGRVLEFNEIHAVETEISDSVPTAERVYDVVWVGRISVQKGINDLLATMEFLNQRLENFRAVLVGNVKGLQPEVAKRGLDKCVEFSGRVSDREKFQLLKSSRVFLLSSFHEGLPLVAAEGVVSNTPVVAYELPHYKAVYGKLFQYVPAFDLEIFKKDAERVIRQMRAGQNPMDPAELDKFRQEHSWKAIQEKFVALWKEPAPPLRF